MRFSRLLFPAIVFVATFVLVQQATANHPGPSWNSTLGGINLSAASSINFNPTTWFGGAGSSSSQNISTIRAQNQGREGCDFSLTTRWNNANSNNNSASAGAGGSALFLNCSICHTYTSWSFHDFIQTGVFSTFPQTSAGDHTTSCD